MTQGRTRWRTRWRWGVAGSLALTMVAGLGILTGAAQADTSPPVANDPANPATVSATPLPTVQINGVAWAQAIIGDTVYVGGQFTQARPAGAPAGSNQTARSNLLAYDIRTGILITSWAPTTNGQVMVVKASADGSRLYIGGDFTTVNGQTQRRIAALDPATGDLITSFRPNPDGRVRAIALTSETVYFGGSFGSVGGQTRSRLAAARASDGAVLAWAPAANDAVWAMELSPDRAQVLAGGQFSTMNGSDRPGKGMASVRASDGSSLPWAANNVIRNGSTNAAITALVSDGTSVYGAGFTMADGGGQLEGVVRMSWNGGAIQWVEDCKGDSYDIYLDADAVYSVGHSHYCGNVPGGFHDEDPWTFKRALAWSKPATQTLRKEYGRYYNFDGTPAPSMLHWFPRIDAGTYTGMSQGAWTVTGNGDYVVAGGEFPRVGTLAQYGLVRFAKKGVSGNANNAGPQVPGSSSTPTVSASGPGEALVSWRTNWDRDNANLTYRVARQAGGTTTVDTRTVRSTEWSRPYLSFLDTGLAAGTYNYRVTATDPDGNSVTSAWVPVTVTGGGTPTDGYAKEVLADGPQHYWRMDEPSGSTAADYTGLDAATGGSGVTRGAAGAIPGNAAATFNGSTSQSGATGTARTSSFATSVEAWFRTTSSSGGKIVGLGNARTGSSSGSLYDRHLYLDGEGRVNFGARQGNIDTSINQVVRSPSGYRDGAWHHAVGVVGDGGMVLYVDGARVAGRDDVTTGRFYTGYWRIGGDTLSGWPNRPPNDYFTGSIDEVAVYTHVLTAGQVRDHFRARTGSTANIPPTAAFTAIVGGRSATFTSTSSDADGDIASHLWDFGDGSTSTQTNPTRTYAEDGTYTVTLTVTDDEGATDSTSKAVTVSASLPTALATDAFGRSAGNGWGSAEIGGAWTVTGGSSNFAVSGGTGAITMPTPGSGPRATLGALSEASTDATVSFSLDKIPNGGGAFVSLSSRANATGSDSYRAKVRVASDGRLTLSLVAVVANAETTLGSVTLPTAANYVVGDRLQLRLQTAGTSPTTLRAKVWKSGTAEPSAWQLERTDSTSALQNSRGVGLATYLSSAATNTPVVARFDDFGVVRLG